MNRKDLLDVQACPAGGCGCALATSSLKSSFYGVQYAADGTKLRSGRMIPVQGLDGGDDTIIEMNTARSGGLRPIKDDNSIPVDMEISMPFEAPTDYVGNLVYKNSVLDKILIDGGYISGGDMNYHFFVTDHLGNVRVVENAAGVIEQQNEFYPYGESIDTGAQFTSDNPYKWGGKEWDADQGAYDFGARMYSASDARWTTMDPLCEKYYSISPYAYCAGNPVNLVDPDGRDIYLFDEQGNYLKRVEQEGMNRAAIRREDKDGNIHISYYDFADPKNDAKDIDDGTINGIQFVSEECLRDVLGSQGTFNSKLNGRDFVMSSNSASVNIDYSYDYSGSVLSNYFTVHERKTETGKELYSNKLFLVDGDRVLHNYMNFGNYLWGASGYTFGFPLWILRLGAHANSLGLLGSDNGYTRQLDSRDDQLSITEGYKHARLNHYRRLRK